eukprot:TRINITY_DN39831_c0_g1_i1.p1 TRINITY_DN39831_c0_g1~~TRINITY_DN39831_c0_g1_i1.p1  ORF type:complete len:529 (+),score=125.17 TRINITY_DN39831_c0_g1_i1:65-1588(+)
MPAEDADWPPEMLWVCAVNTSGKQLLRRQHPPPAHGAPYFESCRPDMAGTVNVLAVAAANLHSQVDTDLDCVVCADGRSITWRRYDENNLTLMLVHSTRAAAGDCAESALATSLLHLVWAVLASVLGCDCDCAPQHDGPLIVTAQRAAPQRVDALLSQHPVSPAALLLRRPCVLVVTPKHRAALSQCLESLCSGLPGEAGADAVLGAVLVVGGRVAAATRNWAAPQLSAPEKELLQWALPLVAMADSPGIAADHGVTLAGSAARLVSVRLSGSCVVVLLCNELAPPLSAVLPRCKSILQQPANAEALAPLLDPRGPAQRGLGWAVGMKPGKLDAITLPAAVQGVLVATVPPQRYLQDARFRAQADWWVSDSESFRRGGQLLLLPEAAAAGAMQRQTELRLTEALWEVLELLSVHVPHTETADAPPLCTEGYRLTEDSAVAWRLQPGAAAHGISVLAVCVSDAVPQHGAMQTLEAVHRTLYRTKGDRDSRRVPEAIETSASPDALLAG